MPDQRTDIIDAVPAALDQPKDGGNKRVTDLIIVGLSRLKPHP